MSIQISECVCALCAWLFATPGTVPHQAPLSMELSRQVYSSGLPFSIPGDLPGSWGLNLCLLHWQADSLQLHHVGSLKYSNRSSQTNSSQDLLFFSSNHTISLFFPRKFLTVFPLITASFFQSLILTLTSHAELVSLQLPWNCSF